MKLLTVAVAAALLAASPVQARFTATQWSALQTYNNGKLFNCLVMHRGRYATEDALDTCGATDGLAEAAMVVVGQDADKMPNAWTRTHCTVLVGGYKCEWHGWVQIWNNTETFERPNIVVVDH